MATLRSELSDASPWLIGELRFAVVLETHAPVKASGAVYALPDGRFFAFAATAIRAEANRLAARLGRNARVLEVRPQWSFSYEAWVTRNPDLWRR